MWLRLSIPIVPNFHWKIEKHSQQQIDSRRKIFNQIILQWKLQTKITKTLFGKLNFSKPKIYLKNDKNVNENLYPPLRQFSSTNKRKIQNHFESFSSVENWNVCKLNFVKSSCPNWLFVFSMVSSRGKIKLLFSIRSWWIDFFQK